MDPAHEFHLAATTWFRKHRADGWATCPTTESGFVRILSNPKYPNITMSPLQATRLLVQLVEANSATHQWWPENISLRDEDVFDLATLTGYKQITDTWLLAVAVMNSGRLATCDRRIGPSGVRGALAGHISPVTQA